MRWLWIASLCCFVVITVGRGLFGKTSEEDRNNWQPRAGAVYDLRGDGRDVLRAGWGRYYDVGYTNANVLFDRDESPCGLPMHRRHDLRRRLRGGSDPHDDVVAYNDFFAFRAQASRVKVRHRAPSVERERTLPDAPNTYCGAL